MRPCEPDLFDPWRRALSLFLTFLGHSLDISTICRRIVTAFPCIFRQKFDPLLIKSKSVAKEAYVFHALSRAREHLVGPK
jgi:hypothetical protein